MLLRGGTVFDGAKVRGTADILIVDGRIAAVGSDLPDVGVGPVIDCRGRTVIPGLVDAHVHLAWAGTEPPPGDLDASMVRAARNAELLLQAGVTTVRDTGGPLEVLAKVAADCASGRLAGPDVAHSGRILCAPGGHGTEVSVAVTIARECDGPDGFRHGVHEQLAGGARFIKVALNGADGHVQLTHDELTAAVDEAHAAGARVACHASVRAAVALAIDCGVDTIEHGNGLDHDLARRMADNDIALVPTIAIFRELKERLEASDDPLLTPEQSAEHRRAVVQRVRDHELTMAAALEAGVIVGLGTDRVPGGDVVAVDAEARALRGGGLTPLDVLHSATAGNARALGLGDRGEIRVGAAADIAVFKGDVTKDIGLLTDPVLVLRNGTRARPHLVQTDQRDATQNA